jgi:hypothetical protein
MTNMPQEQPKLCHVVLFILAALLVSETMTAQEDHRLREISETINVIRKADSPSMSRTDAAEQLADLTRKIDAKSIDDGTLADIVSLLDTSDDSVRYWVATSLGNLGSRAKIAIPKLLKILAEVECLSQSKTSEGGVRYALKKMGVNPPPADCGAAGTSSPIRDSGQMTGHTYFTVG